MNEKKEVKICKQCGKEIIKEEFFSKLTGKYGQGSWSIIRYCSENCRKTFYSSKAKRSLKNTFHDIMVSEVNDHINGKITLFHGNPKSENPDIETETSNYEVEVYGNYTKWLKKYNKRKDSSKKHILIIVPDNRLLEFFDEIKFYIPDNTIKELKPN